MNKLPVILNIPLRFVNCAFGGDKLLAENGNKWLYKNKEHGMMSATASLGLILLWDVDGGLTQIDKVQTDRSTDIHMNRQKYIYIDRHDTLQQAGTMKNMISYATNKHRSYH